MGIAPYAGRRDVPFIAVGDDAHIVPNVRSMHRIFCIVSGSGAGRETIQNLDHVLPTPRLPTGKEVKKPWFLAAFFGYFLSLVKESNPPEARTSRFKRLCQTEATYFPNGQIGK